MADTGEPTRFLALFKHGARRAALRLAKRGGQRRGKIFFSSGLSAPAIDSRRPRDTRNSRSTPNSSCTMRSSRTHSGLSVHTRTAPRWLILRTVSSVAVTVTSFIGARGAEIGAERPVHQQDIEAEKTEHRPSAEQQEHHAGYEA